MEEWKAVKGYEGYYEVSSLGRVRSVARLVGSRRTRKSGEPCTYSANGKMLKPAISPSGTTKRHIVLLYKEQSHHIKTVASLVAEAFLEKPSGKSVVKFKDGNRLNSCLNNLYYHVCQSKPKNVSTGLCRPRKPYKLSNGKQVFRLIDGKVYISVVAAAKENNISEWKVSYDAYGKQEKFRFL